MPVQGEDEHRLNIYMRLAESVSGPLTVTVVSDPETVVSDPESHEKRIPLENRDALL